MGSKVKTETPCGMIGLDGIHVICPDTDVEIYSVITDGIERTVTTDADGNFPETNVDDPPGSTYILRIPYFHGLCGCGAVTSYE